LGPDGFSHLWRALSAGETVILDDVAASAQPGERALWATQGLGGAVLIPLLAKGRILGALWMGRATPGPFSGEEVALAQTMANHIAIAIDNARLYDALRQTSEELESRVEARTRELREAHEELVRNERLALIGQLAGGVGHELRNPLGAMGNAVYYLRMRLAGNEDPKVLKHLGILEREGRRANKIITDLLDFSRVKPPSRVPAQLNAIVQDVLARVPEEPSVQRKLDLDESLPLVEVDQDQVGQVLLNLVDNAVEAMPEGGTLTIRTRATADGIVASVTDTGAGIPPENLEKVFQPLFTTKTRGIGLGLAVSRRLAAANGGTLRLTSRMGEGSTFTVAFPLNGSGPADHA
jgi:signal transduction histidine kinase